MIKTFNAGHIPGGSQLLDETVNGFLRRLKCDYKIHVTATKDYPVIVVEYNP